MKQVYQAENAIDAQLLCDILIEAGYDASVFGGFLTGASGEIPPDGLIKVMVRFADDAAAGSDADSSATSSSESADAGSVGRGTVGKWYFPSRNPDDADEKSFGDERTYKAARRIVAEFDAARSAEAWPRVCNRCGEDSNSRFSHCWNCGAPIDP